MMIHDAYPICVVYNFLVQKIVKDIVVEAIRLIIDYVQEPRSLSLRSLYTLVFGSFFYLLFIICFQFHHESAYLWQHGDDIDHDGWWW